MELEAAPWVWRLQRQTGVITIRSHTGLAARFEAAVLDEAGRLFLATDLGLGIVHSLDMEDAAAAVESGEWVPQVLPAAALPQRFGYRLKPAAEAR